MLATLFLICSNKHRIEIDSITKSLNWLLSSTIIVQGGQYLGKVFGRPIIMLISVHVMIWTDAFIFFRGIFAGPKNMTDTTLRWKRLMEERVGKVSTYWGRLRNRGPPSEGGSKLKLASWRNELMFANPFHFKYTLKSFE